MIFDLLSNVVALRNDRCRSAHRHRTASHQILAATGARQRPVLRVQTTGRPLQYSECSRPPEAGSNSSPSCSSLGGRSSVLSARRPAWCGGVALLQVYFLSTAHQSLTPAMPCADCGLRIPACHSHTIATPPPAHRDDLCLADRVRQCVHDTASRWPYATRGCTLTSSSSTLFTIRIAIEGGPQLVLEALRTVVRHILAEIIREHA
jgi:hypothetical protein